MGLNRKNILGMACFGAICLGIFPAALSAAPMLRLASTTVGPVTIAAGQNGPAQSVDAANAGSGSLALKATANVSWITATVGAQHNCSFNGTCLPVNMALNTSSLAQGTYSGIVTVSDPNAVDAPQTIVVTVQIGSGIPSSMDLYVAPNSSTNTIFTTGTNFNSKVSNPSGGPTLSVASIGGGSFSFTYSYQVNATAPANQAAGNYPGSFAVTSSSFSGDLKTVPVNVHVTTQPIASYTPVSLTVPIAQGAAKVQKWIQVGNTGQGTLSVTSATASGGSWISTALNGNTVVVTLDPTGQSAGAYKGSVAIASNAANGSFTVPVEMDVVAVAAPTSYFQGVRDNAIFRPGDPVAQGDIVELVGDQFTMGSAVQATKLPLQTSIGGATVTVNGTPAPIYYNSASHVINNGGQIDFQIPYETPPGTAIIQVTRDGQAGNSISVQVQPYVPRLLVLDGTAGALAGYAIAVFNDNVTFPWPPFAGLPTRPATVGDPLVFYAIGLGQTSPAATDGAAAGATQVTAPAQVVFGSAFLPAGSIPATPFYIGLTPNFVGLYQVNVYVPNGVPTGNQVPVYLTLGETLSNQAFIAIQ